MAGPAAPTKAGCALRSASYCLSCSAPVSSRSRAADTRLWVASSMFLAVSRSAVDDLLVGAELDDLAELGHGELLDLLHLLGAFVQRLVGRRRQQARPLRRERRALRCELKAGGRRGMSRPLRSIMVLPRWLKTKPAPAANREAMPAITAKAVNRLPRTPHLGILKRGRRRPSKRPRPRRIRHRNSPTRDLYDFRRGVSLGQVKKSQVAQSVACIPHSEKKKGRQ